MAATTSTHDKGEGKGAKGYKKANEQPVSGGSLGRLADRRGGKAVVYEPE